MTKVLLFNRIEIRIMYKNRKGGFIMEELKLKSTGDLKEEILLDLFEGQARMRFCLDDGMIIFSTVLFRYRDVEKIIQFLLLVLAEKEFDFSLTLYGFGEIIGQEMVFDAGQSMIRIRMYDENLESAFKTIYFSFDEANEIGMFLSEAIKEIDE